MKRSAEDAEKEVVVKKRKANPNNTRLEKLMKKYMKKVATMDQTTPDEDVEAEVKNRIPASIKLILKEFDVDQNSRFTKLLPENNIIKIVTNIVVNSVNAPIRRLIYSHLPHYKQLEKVVEERQLVQESTTTIAEDLKQLDPPDEGEPPYSDFVEILHGIMTNIIKRVAGVIEGNELFSGDNVFTNAILSKINLHRNIKTRLCIYLFNIICTFAGEVPYTFFMDDKKLITALVKKNTTQ